MAIQEAVKHTGVHLYTLLPWPLRRSLRLGYEALRLWSSEDATDLGASIAFYSLFALAPLLVITIAIAGEVFGPEAARGQIVEQIGGLVGQTAADSIEKMISSAWHSHASGFAAALGVFALIGAASGVFIELRKALNRIGRIHEKHDSIGAIVRTRLVAFALVLGFGFLFVVSLVLSAAVAGVSSWLSTRFAWLEAVLTLLDIVLSMGVLAVAFWAFLRWLPDRAPTRGAAIVGALASAVLFALGKHLIGLYLGRVTTSSSYGAVGSLGIVMLWIYYSSQILLFGAAIAWTIDGVRAEHPAPKPKAKRKLRIGEAVTQGR
jgi:membrane protein